jgi:hypothetical protein
VALMLASLGVGVFLLAEQQRQVPEQRGIGVLTSVHPNPGRGLALSVGVRFRSCGEPVEVTLVATGTAEFWIDNARALRRGGTVQLAVPDLGLRRIRVGLGTDGKVAAIAPLTQSPEPGPLVTGLPVRRLRSVSVIGAHVARWGLHLRPFVVRFEADWLQRRSHLGSCYLRLPALAGFPTVLSAQEIRGQAVPDVGKLTGPESIFVVSSQETGLQSYYSAELETTRGVTSIALGSSALRTDLSQPAPDANVGGAASWTCSTTPPRSVETLESVKPGSAAPEIIEGAAVDAKGALSASRLGGAVAERTCASFAVLDESRSGVSRDITLLLIGAIFSIGVGLAVEGLRRKRRSE